MVADVNGKTHVLPVCEKWELEEVTYMSLSSEEQAIVQHMMESIIDIGQASGLDLWLLNPRANATREKIAQWVIDRRELSTPSASGSAACT
jgi:hypothetical protein